MEWWGLPWPPPTAQGIVAVAQRGCAGQGKGPPPALKPQHFVGEKRCGKILRTGISPFGLSLSPSIILIFGRTGKALPMAGKPGGRPMLWPHYIVESVMLFLSGIGEGLQPLISYLKGAREYQQMKAVKNKGLRVALIISCTLSVILFLARGCACRVWHIVRGQRTDGQCAVMVRIRVPAHCRCQAFLFPTLRSRRRSAALFMIYPTLVSLRRYCSLLCR